MVSRRFSGALQNHAFLLQMDWKHDFIPHANFYKNSMTIATFCQQHCVHKKSRKEIKFRWRNSLRHRNWIKFRIKNSWNQSLCPFKKMFENHNKTNRQPTHDWTPAWPGLPGPGWGQPTGHQPRANQKQLRYKSESIIVIMKMRKQPPNKHRPWKTCIPTWPGLPGPGRGQPTRNQRGTNEKPIWNKWTSSIRTPSTIKVTPQENHWGVTL